MVKTNVLDPQGGLKVVDTETNKNVVATGREDLDQADYLELTVNGTARQAELRAKNDGQTPVPIPLHVHGFTFGAAEAHTAGDTLTRDESGSIHTNDGAAGAITLILPAATVGMVFLFVVKAAQELRLDPNGTETIATPLTGTPGAAGKYLTANALGESALLVCTKAGEWDFLGGIPGLAAAKTWDFEA